MSAETEGERLRTRLREALAELIASDGWRVLLGGGDRSFRLVELARACGAGIEATVSVGTGVRVPDRAPVHVSGLHVGLTYRPLRELEPLLGAGFGLCVLQAELDRQGTLNAFDEPQSPSDPVAEEDQRREYLELEISTDADAISAAATLAELVLAHGTRLADRFATVDDLIAELDRPDGDDGVDLRVPALLAADGRFEDAGAALERYQPRADSDWDARDFGREDRRAAYQLRRWIHSRGAPSIMPTSAPPSRLEIRVSRPSFAELRAHARLRDEAVKAARAGTPEGDRERARERLVNELDARGVDESPLWIERTVDHLWDTPADQLRQGIQGAKTLARLGIRVAKALRDRQFPDLPSSPAWLDPPDPAFYELPRSEHWIEVTLDRDSDGWLDTVHHAAKPSFAGISLLDAWLTNEPANGTEQIVVHLGERRVGTIPDADSSAYLPVLRAAVFRAELPRIEARLSRSNDRSRHLLELALPPEQ